MLSAAIDFQGGKAARPYVEKAAAQFTTVVDTENLLSSHFGFRAIPNMVFIDEAGIIRFIKFTGFDIRHETDRAFVTRFIESPNVEHLARDSEQGTGFDDPIALVHFQTGMASYRRGDTSAALDVWREAVAMEPENWIIRKQIWAIAHPERFYAGDVDFDWQKDQIAEGQ